jgi:4-carboxymuconolactone decarboxylase
MESPMADAFERGMKTRREVLGDEHVDRAESAKTDFDRDFQEFITRYAWGETWSRGQLDRRERHLVTLAVLCALGREHELTMHLRATARTGVSTEDVAELLQHVAVYAGLPVANSAFRVAKEVLPMPSVGDNSSAERE